MPREVPVLVSAKPLRVACVAERGALLRTGDAALAANDRAIDDAAALGQVVRAPQMCRKEPATDQTGRVTRAVP